MSSPTDGNEKIQDKIFSSSAALLVVLLLGLAGCAGYGPGRADSIVLAPEYRTLYIKDVDNPTLSPDLSARLRSGLRDEMTRRGHIAWSERGRGTAFVKLRVERFTSTTSITDKYDQSVLQSAEITLSAAIHKAQGGDSIWNSGQVSASQTFLTGDRAAAEEQVIDLAVRQLVDRLYQDF